MPKDTGREKESFLLQPFILFRPSVDWVRPTHIGETVSTRNTLTSVPRNYVQPNIQISVAQSSGHIESVITPSHPSSPSTLSALLRF